MCRSILASLIHDTAANLLATLENDRVLLAGVFDGLALSITEATDQRVVTTLETRFGARVIRHRVGENIIGQARRSAVALALEMGASRIIYADFDTVLHWLKSDRKELAQVLDRDDPFLIVGRSDASLAHWPQRLRQTEATTNHVYSLMTAQKADLLAAVRSMSREVAAAVVAHAKEEGIANDVEWPLLARRLGILVSEIKVDGLAYRTIEEFSAEGDTLDEEPLQWIRRMEFAAQCATAMRKFL